MPSHTLVVDASLALKWVLPEEDDDKALQIRALYQAGQLRLIAPHALEARAARRLDRGTTRR
jgi:predicted nucleic acid-binding protein